MLYNRLETLWRLTESCTVIDERGLAVGGCYYMLHSTVVSSSAHSLQCRSLLCSVGVMGEGARGATAVGERGKGKSISC